MGTSDGTGQAWPVALDPLPLEGTSGKGMCWVGKGAQPRPTGVVSSVVHLSTRGGSLLLVAVPS